MRSYLFVALVALASGCCQPCASTGWRFEVGRPGTVTSPALVQQTSGTLTVGGIGAGPGVIASQSASALTGFASGVAPPTAALSSSCTLDDVCRKLDRIQTLLLSGSGEGLRMPRSGQ